MRERHILRCVLSVSVGRWELQMELLDRILIHSPPFSPQDKFLPFVDMFQKESVKVEVCKIITNAFLL